MTESVENHSSVVGAWIAAINLLQLDLVNHEIPYDTQPRRHGGVLVGLAPQTNLQAKWIMGICNFGNRVFITER